MAMQGQCSRVATVVVFLNNLLLSMLSEAI